MSKVCMKFILASFRKQKSHPWLGGLCFFMPVCLFRSHRCHPNRQLVLKIKDRNNNDKDEAEKNSLHGLFYCSLPKSLNLLVPDGSKITGFWFSYFRSTL
jgi:hypothetical protein